MGSKGHGDGHTLAQIARELRLRKSAPALGLEFEDLVAHVVAEEIGVVVVGGPGAVRDERPAGDRGASGVVAVLVNRRRVGCSGQSTEPGATRVVVVALAEVPGVVGPCLALVDFFPAASADVVDEEARARGVRVEGEAEGVPQARSESLLALLAGSVRPVTLQRALSVPV